MKRACRLLGGFFVAGLLASAANAQVISIDETGVSRTYCTAAQNGAGADGTSSTATAASLYRPYFERAGRRYGISPDLLDAVAKQESNYNPHAVSPKGAIGIMQLMPATAHALRVNPYNVEQNIQGGAAYLRDLLDLYDGRIDLALGAYNAGQQAVDRYGGVPPFRETRFYLLRSFEDMAQKSDRQAAAQPVRQDTGYIQICRR